MTAHTHVISSPGSTTVVVARREEEVYFISLLSIINVSRGVQRADSGERFCNARAEKKTKTNRIIIIYLYNVYYVNVCMCACVLFVQNGHNFLRTLTLVSHRFEGERFTYVTVDVSKFFIGWLIFFSIIILLYTSYIVSAILSCCRHLFDF